MEEYIGQLHAAHIHTHIDTIKDFDAANTLGEIVKNYRRLVGQFSDYRSIVFTDAFDVLFYGTREQVIDKVPERGVLLGAERNCYPDPTLKDKMPGSTPWRFMNGGLLAGTPENILEWLEGIEGHPYYIPEMCNQAFFNLVRLNNQYSPVCPLDESTNLFYCLHSDIGELQFKNGLPVNTVTGTHPNFIHANGQWPMRRPPVPLGLPGKETKLVKMDVSQIRLMGQAEQPDAKKVEIGEQPKWTQEGANVSAARPDVAICIPFGNKNPDGSMRWIPPDFSIALAMVISNLPMHVNARLFCTKGEKRDMTRNQLVREALEAKATYIWFIDDDNPPPPTALVKLKYVMDLSGDDVALCGGIYTTKSDPGMPLVFLRENGGVFWKWRVGDVFECGAIATGCMMIRASVFSKIPEPWFHDITDLEDAHRHGWFLDQQAGGDAAVTDDMYFCRKVREAGFRMLAHGGVLPGHWGQDGVCYRLGEDTYPYKGSVEVKYDRESEPVLSA